MGVLPQYRPSLKAQNVSGKCIRANPIDRILTELNEEILKIAKQACLKIVADDKVVKIKHKFRLRNKSNFGLLLFLFGGVFLILIPVFKSSTETSKYIAPGLGLFFIVLSILTLIRQISDGIIIKDGNLKVRFNLKTTTISMNKELKVKMRLEIMKIRRTDFIIIKHFLQDQNKEIPILSFHMEKTNSNNAQILGKKVSSIINSRLYLTFLN